jgi:hypothetical protein
MTETVLPIVEGQSEEEAVPVLLRRLLSRLGREDVTVARPFRVHRNRVVRPKELERAMTQGLRSRQDVSGVLVILDADDDEPEALEALLLKRCQAITPIPTLVVLATRELESWFLGSKDSLRGVRGIKHDANAPNDPETIRGAKERLSRNMVGRRYLEVDDQPAFAARVDLDLALQRCSSFRRLADGLERILAESSRAQASPHGTS